MLALIVSERQGCREHPSDPFILGCLRAQFLTIARREVLKNP